MGREGDPSDSFPLSQTQTIEVCSFSFSCDAPRFAGAMALTGKVAQPLEIRAFKAKNMNSLNRSAALALPGPTPPFMYDMFCTHLSSTYGHCIVPPLGARHSDPVQSNVSPLVWRRPILPLINLARIRFGKNRVTSSARRRHGKTEGSLSSRTMRRFYAPAFSGSSPRVSQPPAT